MKIKTDSQLNTESEILERLAIIRRNRDIGNDTPCRSNSIEAWRNKCKRIAKLTEREGNLINMLKTIRKGE